MKFSDIKTDQTLPTNATSIRAKIGDENVTIFYQERAYAGDTHLNRKYEIIGLTIHRADLHNQHITHVESIKDKALANRLFSYEGFHEGCNKNCWCLKDNWMELRL
jgi:hypothetical protein